MFALKQIIHSALHSVLLYLLVCLSLPRCLYNRSTQHQLGKNPISSHLRTRRYVCRTEIDAVNLLSWRRTSRLKRPDFLTLHSCCVFSSCNWLPLINILTGNKFRKRGSYMLRWDAWIFAQCTLQEDFPFKWFTIRTREWAMAMYCGRRHWIVCGVTGPLHNGSGKRKHPNCEHYAAVVTRLHDKIR